VDLHNRKGNPGQSPGRRSLLKMLYSLEKEKKNELDFSVKKVYNI